MPRFTLAQDHTLPGHYRVVKNGQAYVTSARPYPIANDLCEMLNNLDKEQKREERKQNRVTIVAVMVLSVMAIWWGACGFPGDADTYAINHGAEVR